MNFPESFDAIKNGAVVITVNQRLARHLLSKVEQAYIAEGAVTWLSPSIIPFDTWLMQHWQERFAVVGDSVSSLLNKTLLKPEQVQVLWQQVIRDGNGSELLNVPATAKAANSARQFALAWGINSKSGINDPIDQATFNDWHVQYKALLAKNNWIDTPSVFEAVYGLIAQGSMQTPKHIILAGVDVFTTSQGKLWALLRKQGCEIDTLNLDKSTKNVQVITSADVKGESWLIAQWTREQLTNNPNANIGVVVPDLQSQRQDLETAFMRTFYPSITYNVNLPLNKPYNVSLGLSLSHYAPVQQALRLLRFFSQGLVLNELGEMFRSPFISAGQAEWGERASLDVRLRERGILKLSIKQLRTWLAPNEQQDALCPIWAVSINGVMALLDTRPNRTNASDWADLFRRLLAMIGLQGDRELSSEEYQVFQAWDDVLCTFSGLNNVQGVMTFDVAITALKLLANERIFQPETPTTPIQIMGLMESAGHTFDALWVCGLHDQCWPPAPSPNPFLPIDEQRKQGLIQSSAELQYQQAKRQTEHWASSASVVVFSYPKSDGNTPLLISPLLEDFNLVEQTDVVQALADEGLQERIGGDCLEAMNDNVGPTHVADGITRGGVSILKDQAACPFKAFAHKRLLASAIEQPEPGIDARLRGSLVHRSLEGVWAKIKSHQQLLRLSIDEQHVLVESIVKDVVEKESWLTPILKKSFGALEIKRIVELLTDWLSIDRAREPFDVAATELKQTLTIGALHINTSIDRVDTLADGSSVIIDYKTGSVATGSWFGERPEEPQLPLYGVFGGDGVQSIAFAQLKKGEAKYVGMSDCAEQFSALKGLDKTKGAEADWDAQMARWQAVAIALTNQFVAGDARVMPTKKACDYCDLSSLCRINEQTTEEQAND